MKKLSVLAMLMAIGMLALPTVVKADGMYGKDITITGKVVQAVIDDASGKAYVLKPEHAKEPLPAVIQTGATVTVDGDEMTKGGYLAIRVERAK